MPEFIGKLPFLFCALLVQYRGRGDEVKVKIEENASLKDTEIIVRCPYVDEELQRLIKQIQTFSNTIQAEYQGNFYAILITDILYIHSEQEQTYLHCEDVIYRCDKKLYEVEALLRNMDFVRISKSCIVNCAALVHIRPFFDGKFEALLQNKETVIINRHYVKAFKEVFGR